MEIRKASTFRTLPDPCNDRMVKSVDSPPNKPLETDQLFPYPGICKYIELLSRCGSEKTGLGTCEVVFVE